jgi:type II secretory pathway pseudopilin PulG
MRAYLIQRSAGRRAMTMPELLVVAGILVVLGALLLPLASRARVASRRAECLSNLRQLGIALQLYNREEGLLPYPAETQVPWERSLARYVPTDLFRCPGDAELAPATGSSYDWRDTGDPITTLAGKGMAELAQARPNAVLAFEALPGWHDKARINVVFVDGGARTIDQRECFLDLDLSPAPPGTGFQSAIMVNPTGGTGGSSRPGGRPAGRP